MKTHLRKSRRTLATLLGVVLLNGCSPQQEVGPKPEIYKIEVGKGKCISNYYTINYCGMPNKETLSLSDGGSWAVNLYYSIATTNINWGDQHCFKVLKVTPEELTVQIQE